MNLKRSNMFHVELHMDVRTSSVRSSRACRENILSTVPVASEFYSASSGSLCPLHGPEGKVQRISPPASGQVNHLRTGLQRPITVRSLFSEN
jgi:hypothetical protein